MKTVTVIHDWQTYTAAAEGSECLQGLCRQERLLPITPAIGFDFELGILVTISWFNFESGGQRIKIFDASRIALPADADGLDALRSKAFEIIKRDDSNLATLLVLLRIDAPKLIYTLTQESLLMSLRTLERRTVLLDVSAEDLICAALCDSLWLDTMVPDATSRGLTEASIVREGAPGERGDTTLCSRRF